MTDPIRNAYHSRRSFIKLCMGAVTAGQIRQSFAASRKPAKKYNRVQLVDGKQNPITSKSLSTGTSYVFHYPFITTPCFLLDLGEPVKTDVTLRTEDGDKYNWSGGIGPNHSIVAFCAICAHKMTHPAKAVSFINYRHGTITYQDKNHRQKKGSHLIYCCSERSVYDVRRGAAVLGGPANQPLATVLLDYDETTDRIFAVGTSGGELYDRFFQEFTHRLQLEYRITEVDQLVNEKTEVVLLDEFSETRMTC